LNDSDTCCRRRYEYSESDSEPAASVQVTTKVRSKNADVPPPPDPPLPPPPLPLPPVPPPRIDNRVALASPNSTLAQFPRPPSGLQRLGTPTQLPSTPQSCQDDVPVFRPAANAEIMTGIMILAFV